MRTPWPLIALLVAAGVVAAFHVGKMPPSIPSIRAELDARGIVIEDTAQGARWSVKR